MKKAIVITLLLGAMTIVSAEDTWQYEAALQGYSASSDSGHSRAISGIARYYYAPLPEESDYPLAEAMYMERIGYVGGAYQRYDIDGSDMSGDGTYYQLGTIFLQPGSNFAASLHVSNMDNGYQFLWNSQPVSSTNDSRVYSVGLGYFLRENLLAAVSYGYEKTKSSYTATPPLIIPTTTNEKRTTTLQLRYWSRLGENFVVLEPSYDYAKLKSVFSDGKSISAGVRGLFYWSKYQDVWLRYSLDHGDDISSDMKSYGAGYDVFLTRSVSLNFMYGFSKASDCSGGCISRSWSVTAGMRF